MEAAGSSERAKKLLLVFIVYSYAKRPAIRTLPME